MARRKRQPGSSPRRKNWAPAGQVVRLEHMDPESQQAIQENWAHMGLVASKHLPEAKERAAAGAVDPGISELGRSKHEKRVRSFAAIEPHVKDIPLTLEGAQEARVERIRQGRERAKKQGTWTDPHTGWELPALPEGTAWYFGHHADIASSAREFGIDKRKAINVTTNMSPNNDPETEKKAGRAIMDMVANGDQHTVRITPELHKRANAKIAGRDLKGDPMPASWVGKDVQLSQMHAKHIAGIASVAAEMREKHKQPVQSTAPFEDLGAARGAGNAYRGIEHLRGDRSEEDLLDPHTAPKVTSYRENVQDAVPGSAEHLEYLARAMDFQRGGTKAVKEGRRTPPGVYTETPQEQVARQSEQAKLHQTMATAEPGSLEHRLASVKLSLSGIRQGPMGQHMIPDLRPLRRSDQGMLSPEKNTAEDTWMHSISTRQDPRSVRTEGGSARSSTSIAKTVGTDPDLAGEKRMTKASKTSEATVATDSRVRNAALQHALNNYATRSAAKQVGMPAVFAQETPWMEQRIRAAKAPEYRKKLATEARFRGAVELRRLPKAQAPLGRQFPMAQPNPVTPIHHAAAKALYDRVTGGGPAATPEEISHVEQMRSHAQAAEG